MLDLRRIDGNRLSEGKGRPAHVVIGADGSAIIAVAAEAVGGTDTSAISALDAGAIGGGGGGGGEGGGEGSGGRGAGTGLALATTAFPKSRGRSRTFHDRTSPEALPSSASSARARLGSQG